MADLPITILDASSGDSGFRDLLRFVGTSKIPSPRLWARPLRFLNSNYSKDLSERGKTVTVQVNPIVSTQLMTDGQATSNDDTAPTAVDMTLNRVRYSKFAFTQVYNAMKSGPEVFDGFMQSRVSGLLNDVERDVFSFPPTLINNAGTYNTNINEAAVLGAMTSIVGNAPPQAPLIALIKQGATSWSALSQITGFSSASYRGFQEMSPMVTGVAESGNGSVPWHGINFFLTQTPPQSGTSISNVVFHPYSIGYVNRGLVPPGPGVEWANFEVDGVQFQMTQSWNKDTFSTECAIRALYGYAILNNNWSVELRA